MEPLQDFATIQLLATPAGAAAAVIVLLIIFRGIFAKVWNDTVTKAFCFGAGLAIQVFVLVALGEAPWWNYGLALVNAGVIALATNAFDAGPVSSLAKSFRKEE